MNSVIFVTLVIFLNSGESGISDVFVILVNLRIFGNVVILVNLVILLKPMIF